MLFYMITNNPSIGEYILRNGVGRIFIDLEKLGKNERQGHLNTWQSDHCFNDILNMRKRIKEKNFS